MGSASSGSQDCLVCMSGRRSLGKSFPPSARSRAFDRTAALILTGDSWGVASRAVSQRKRCPSSSCILGLKHILAAPRQAHSAGDPPKRWHTCIATLVRPYRRLGMALSQAGHNPGGWQKESRLHDSALKIQELQGFEVAQPGGGSDKDGNEEQEGQERQEESGWQRLAARSSFWSPARKDAIQAFIIKHWLPLIFAVAIMLALAWPVPGKALLHITVLGDVHITQEIPMGIVFFISGLALNTQDLKKAKGHVTGVVFGFFSVLILTPMLGFAMREIPLEPKLFTIGLTIFCAVPTTLGVGVALVRSCRGNDGVALLMTVGTNLLGVGTMPLMLKLLFLNYDLSGLNITVDILNLFTKLIITILGPSVLGKIMRDVWPAAERFANKYKVHLNLFSTFCLAFIIWQTLSGARDLLFQSNAGMIVSVIVISASMYCFYLLVNYLIITLLLRMPTPEAISVIIIASQKSAPVAVTVISYITSDVSQQGLLAIPCIVGQLTQIFAGAAMVPPISKRADAYYACQEEMAAEAEAASRDVETPQLANGSSTAAPQQQEDTALQNGSTTAPPPGPQGSGSVVEAGPQGPCSAVGREDENSSLTTCGEGTTGKALGSDVTGSPEAHCEQLELATWIKN